MHGPTINQLTPDQFASLLNAMHREEGIRAGTTIPLHRCTAEPPSSERRGLTGAAGVQSGSGSREASR